MDKFDLFHQGELYFQRLSGVENQVANFAPRLISDELNLQHSDFFSQLKYLFIGSIDQKGRPWASVITGKSGFINIPDNKHLQIASNLIKGDPLNDNLQTDHQLGFLGLDFQSRRRNRMCGEIQGQYQGGFVVEVNKVFGNCPKYIQARDIHFMSVNIALSANNAKKISRFDDDHIKLITSLDTFFIASHYKDNHCSRSDISHRGGKPGFIQVLDDKTLIFDDYSGNSLYMTMGNLHSNPVAGILFIDFTTGDILQLTCTCKIIEPEGDSAMRKIQLILDQGCVIKSALKIDSNFLSYSPFLP